VLDAAVAILFVGNSLTATNDLSGMVEAMGRAAGVNVRCAAVAKPNFSLEDHWNDGEARPRSPAATTSTASAGPTPARRRSSKPRCCPRVTRGGPPGGRIPDREVARRNPRQTRGRGRA
jgi:hypothetical protein